MIKFSKLHGNGNDYVFMEEITEKLPELSRLAVQVSNRNFGIGSDGLIVASPSEVADFRMIMMNADGSRGKMCGNGIRALAKYAFDKGLVKKKEMRIETDSGIKTVLLSYDSQNPTLAYASVTMGVPVFQSSSIPFCCDAPEVRDYPLTIRNNKVFINAVSMGNPHSVSFFSEMNEEVKAFFMKDKLTHESLDFFNDTKELGELRYFDIESFGTQIQEIESFTEGVNVEIAKVIDRKTIAMRVFERGSGETLSCGTGCCAVAVAAIRKGMIDCEVKVHTLGGSLDILWDGKPSSEVVMKGHAKTVFEGEFLL